MITNSELRISNESYTKKDFYQIYPEILDLVGKITDKWDPASSNESDPGVVLLKVLAFVADKLNYNMDKNILEVFMASATQQESMKKLCDMMGYDMHYYNSATTNVAMMWTGDELTLASDGNTPTQTLVIPRFTALSDDDGNNIFITTEEVSLEYKNIVKNVVAIEGEIVDLDINNDYILKSSNLDDSHRFYLPESQIAENGIWLIDAVDSSTEWTKVSNLNTETSGKLIWKFGYSSKKKLPYIQFPEDVNELLTNGVKVKYIRTTGANGNISAQTLTKVSAGVITSITLADNSVNENVSTTAEDGTALLIIKNASASINGKDLETLDEAYNNFKRTVGTFDTLVTCRDYANTIYNMLNNTVDTKHLVSNVQVSDIRTDINKVNKIVTLGEYGIVFEDIAEKELTEEGTYVDAINHFDLYMYPLNPINNTYNETSYINSFKPNDDYWTDILDKLEEHKTIAHKIKKLSTTDYSNIYLLKNYYSLKATIATTYKVSNYEALQIKNNIYSALYQKFNAHEVEFGQDLSYDLLLETIEKADTRIKVVSLAEPTLKTKYMLADGTEYLLSNDYDTATDNLITKNTDVYQKMVIKNVLAGRLALFDYNTDLTYSYGMSNSTYNVYGKAQNFPKSNLGAEPAIVTADASNYSITNITSEVKIPVSLTTTNSSIGAEGYTLKENQTIQLIAPNLKTTVVYPAYVNYHFITSNLSASVAVEACSLSKLSENTAEEFNEKAKSFAMYVRKSNQPNYSLPATGGYLVDNSYYAYKKVFQFQSGYSYYYFDPSKDSLGKDAAFNAIKANSEYKLQPGDYLYINYTDNDGLVHDIEYNGNATDNIISRTNNVIQSTETGLNIIQPTFDLYNSNSLVSSGTRSYPKTTGFCNSWSIAGMFSLDSNSEINIRDYVTNTIKDVTKCYWFTDNGKLQFNYTGESEGGYYIFEYLLNSGEYFFYTNDVETTLFTLGSGTKLKIRKQNLPLSNTVIWELGQDATLNMDSVAQQGIGAFSDTDWQRKQFTEMEYLTIQEMQIVSLTEGDTIQDVVFIGENNVTNAVINNQWKTIDSNKFKYNSSNTLALGNDPAFSWRIRSNLLLALGPNLTQKLKNTSYTNGDTTAIVTESISLYTSYWKLKTDGSYVTNPEQIMLGKLIECPLSTELIKFTDVDLRCNYLIQRSGGEHIVTHKYNIDGTILDDLTIYPFKQANTIGYKHVEGNETLVPSEIEFNLYNDRYSKIEFSEIESLVLPVYIPAYNFGIMSIYYIPSVTEESDLITLTSKNNSLAYYTDLPWSKDSTTWSTSVRLKNGLNIIQIKQGDEITLNRNSDLGAIINILNLSVIHNIPNNEDSSISITANSGLDYKKLGIKISDCDAFIKKITDIASNKFLFNAPVDNSLELEVDTMTDSYAWTDKNNICNNFVISQLDLNSLSDIDIARSSRISK